MKKYSIPFIILGTLLGIYLLMGVYAANTQFYTPSNEIDLASILEKNSFSEADYTTLYEQTGLAKPMIDILKDKPDFKEEVLRFQTNYFKEQHVQKTAMNPLTRIDIGVDEAGNQTPLFELAPYENGYIFLTKSTYTANWRHGHAGIVIDAKRGVVLESLEPGTMSMQQDASKWTYYPTFKMMRLKDTSQEKLDEIANFAATHLQNIPYNILAMKFDKTVPSSTHCSHIVWQAFKDFGINLDSSGGIIISPQDLAESPYLETMQIYGFNPNKSW